MPPKRKLPPALKANQKTPAQMAQMGKGKKKKASGNSR